MYHAGYSAVNLGTIEGCKVNGGSSPNAGPAGSSGAKELLRFSSIVSGMKTDVRLVLIASVEAGLAVCLLREFEELLRGTHYRRSP